MKEKSIAWALLIYGLILIASGSFGYYMSGSSISLYTGAGFGLAVILSSLALFWGLQKWGIYSALLFTFILAIFFSSRYFITGKGILACLAILSASLLFFLLVRKVNWK